MDSNLCGSCGAPTGAGAGEFRELRGPGVAIVDVPARVCATCGTALFSREVMRRLAVILAVALHVADVEGLRNLVWTYTPSGPPEFGGLGAEVRKALAGLPDVISTERRLLEATDQAAQALDPWVLLH